jgi:hypothetical protein
MQYVDVTASVKDYDGVEICVCVWEREKGILGEEVLERECVCVFERDLERVKNLNKKLDKKLNARNKTI